MIKHDKKKKEVKCQFMSNCKADTVKLSSVRS